LSDVLYRDRRKSMTDEDFNRMLDTIAGLLFGLGFGMIIGHYLI